MTDRLVNPDIVYISILTDDARPANGKNVKIKGKDYKHIMDLEFKKFDEIEGDIFFMATISGEQDTDKETYYKSDTVFSQRNLMKKEDLHSIFDVNHDMKPRENVRLVESAITDGNGLMVKGEYDKYETLAFEGAVNVKENKELYQKAKDKSITGVSIFGYVEDVEKDVVMGKSEGMLEKIYNKLFGKEEIKIEENDMTKEEMIEFLKSDEGKELVKAVNELPPVEETPEETPAEEVEITEEAPEEVPNEELEAEKAKVKELEAEVEKLKAEKEVLAKMKTHKSAEKEIVDEEVTKEQFEKMDVWDKIKIRETNPELYKTLKGEE